MTKGLFVLAFLAFSSTRLGHCLNERGAGLCLHFFRGNKAASFRALIDGRFGHAECPQVAIYSTPP